MIALTKDWYCLALWCGSLPDVFERPGDILIAVQRHKDDPETTWVMTYRFQYHVDEKFFDSNDSKTWYRLRAENRTAESMETAVAELAKRSGLILDRYALNCWGDDAGKKLAESPPSWMRFQKETVS